MLEPEERRMGVSIPRRTGTGACEQNGDRRRKWGKRSRDHGTPGHLFIGLQERGEISLGGANTYSSSYVWGISNFEQKAERMV